MSERWVTRTVEAAEERRAVAERQRNFARQLKADVDALEGKLGGLERQVFSTCYFATRALAYCAFRVLISNSVYNACLCGRCVTHLLSLAIVVLWVSVIFCVILCCTACAESLSFEIPAQLDPSRDKKLGNGHALVYFVSPSLRCRLPQYRRSLGRIFPIALQVNRSSPN